MHEMLISRAEEMAPLVSASLQAQEGEFNPHSLQRTARSGVALDCV